MITERDVGSLGESPVSRRLASRRLKETQALQISFSPFGMISNHPAKGLWRKGIAWTVIRNGQFPAILVSVSLMTTTLVAQFEPVPEKCANHFASSETPQLPPIDGHQIVTAILGSLDTETSS